MITSKDGTEGNGTAAAAAAASTVASSSLSQDRDQEMVTLMNKETLQENGNTEEFTVIKLEESPDQDKQAWGRRVEVEGAGTLADKSGLKL